LTAPATAVQANERMIDPVLERRLREAFDRWNAGDHTFDPQWTSPDVEVQSAVGDFGGTTYRGQEGVAAWVADMTEAFDEWSLELDEIEEFTPGRVLGVGTVHLRGRGSGVSVDQPCAWIFDHDDGIVTRFEPFLNRVAEARAIAASG
jgi:ketosteroid isomerase-like protein